MNAVSIATQLDIILQKEFDPVFLKITDDSHKHAGHSGARPEGETHFHVKIISHGFEGAGKVARQRMVYAALSELIPPIHALQLQCLTPDEA